MAMNGEEHLRWCKQRAMEYVNAGDWASAVASMINNLGKHPDTVRLVSTAAMLMSTVRDVPSARNFVEGFN